MAMRELILGGARSGKSTLAEQRARDSGLAVSYIATAAAGDEEMAVRIARHRARRPSAWGLVEAPLALAQALRSRAAPDRCLLVDCLTLWLSNLLAPTEADPGNAGTHEAVFEREREALLTVLPALPGYIILVSNEVGMGIVPLGALTRRYRDEAGRLHQQLAALVDRVTLVVAGLAQTLKG